MNSQNLPIGIFDSGIGGLTVLSTLRQKFPNESFIYFADTLNLPYGNKSPEVIQNYSRKILSWFQEKMNVKMVVAACNTSSSLAIDQLSSEFTIPIIGTIHPLIQTILRDKYQRVGLIATPSTVLSRCHEINLLKSGYDGIIHPIACPEFVPLIEQMPMDRVALRNHAQEYLRCFDEKGLETLVYGCTHYPYLEDILKTFLPESTRYLDPAHAIATEVESQLNQSQKGTLSSEVGQLDFYCSGDPLHFKKKIGFLTDFNPTHVYHTDLSLASEQNPQQSSHEFSHI